jgi:hypothetical protein
MNYWRSVAAAMGMALGLVAMRLNLPIYLDADVLSYLSQVAAKKELPVSEVVNELLKKDIAIIESAR